MASLNIIQGPQTGTHFELARRPLSVGRDPSRDIQILDPKVSRKHAIIRYEGDNHVIVVSSAKNGIKINGSEIDDHATLNEGDEIRLGDTVLQFTELGAYKGDAVHELKAATKESWTRTIVEDRRSRDEKKD